MGILYVVPTPVGNLEDITMRAVRILREADFVLAEDTRTSAKLLKHLDIQVPMYSHHKFNEHKTVGSLAERIRDCEHHVALISDAGTPAISDPGFLLVREAVRFGVEVQCLCSCAGKFGTAMRQVCLRGLPASEKRPSEPTELP